MKSKQLGNVLIKILGLSACLHAIPSCVSAITIGFISLARSEGDIAILRIFSTVVGTVAEAAVGLFIIGKSRKIAEFLFKNDDD